jgi:hypothetical protein
VRFRTKLKTVTEVGPSPMATPRRLDRAALDFARGRLRPEWRDLLSTISGLLWEKVSPLALRAPVETTDFAKSDSSTQWEERLDEGVAHGLRSPLT